MLFFTGPPPSLMLLLFLRLPCATYTLSKIREDARVARRLSLQNSSSLGIRLTSFTLLCTYTFPPHSYTSIRHPLVQHLFAMHASVDSCLTCGSFPKFGVPIRGPYRKDNRIF